MSAATRPDVAPTGWEAVCSVTDLLTERGAVALVHGEQVALFRLADGAVHAVQQRDPFSGANVMSRGIVGTRRGRATVAAPMYKQIFDLGTGRCLDTIGYQPQPGCAPDLAVYPVTVARDMIWVGLPERAEHPDEGAP